ncbi:MAG: hypothetical protein JW839_04040 [Candidatus Lokiarchaeota archaeon]|nr:hypothetical protein [Candidatus Lokiarchaeota archaeon]
MDDGITTFNPGDVVADFSKLCTASAVIDNITVYDDHDTVGAGDFYLRVYSTHASPSGDYVWETGSSPGISLGSYNSGFFYDTNILFSRPSMNHTWLGLYLYDDDAGIEDGIGYGSFAVLTYNFGANRTYRQSVDFNGDVTIWFIVTISWAGSRTALDACMQYLPYLYTDIDISIPDPRIEALHVRLLRGLDSSIGRTTYCIQVMFYWSIERDFSGNVLHYNDYEPMVIFVDPAVSWLPYRIAFDNGFYWSGAQDGDDIWWRCHDYRVYEELGYTGRSAGTFNRSCDISGAIQPFLGSATTMTYGIHSYATSFYDLADYPGNDAAAVNQWGIIVPVITLETFYHTFDKGLPTGGSDFGYPYANTTWMTDTTIKSWYGVLQQSFTGGTHTTSGNPTPWYQPFHWDVFNPFAFPLVTNYDKLVNDVAAYTNAKASRSFWVEKVASFHCTFQVSFSYSLAVPKSVSAGTACWINGSIAIDKYNTLLRIDYEIGFILHFNLSYFKRDYDFTFDGYFLIDLNGLSLNFAGMTFTWEGIACSFENDYLDATIVIAPKIFGTLVDATVEFSLFSFLETYFPTDGVFSMLKTIIGEVVYRADIVLTGGIQGAVRANGSPIATFLFNSEATTSMSFTSKYTPATSSLAISVGDIAYNLGFVVNHQIRLEYSKWLCYFIGTSQSSWDLGAYPDVSVAIPLPVSPVQLYPH